jgi:hypothetical protein
MSESQETYKGEGNVTNALKEAGAMFAAGYLGTVALSQFLPRGPLNAVFVAAVSVGPAIGAMHGWRQATAAKEQFKEHIAHTEQSTHTVSAPQHQGMMVKADTLSISP